jgi:hypothetical protein
MKQWLAMNGIYLDELAPTLTPRAAALQRSLQRRARSAPRGAAQWPLILSRILSYFFQHPNLISFYIFSLQMLRHFEVWSKFLSLFPLLHCVSVRSAFFCTLVLYNSLLRIV